MHVEVDGLVLKEQPIGESDRLITILTGKYGIVRAFVRRAKSVKSKLLAGTQLLSYSDFVLYKGKNSYTVDSAQVKEVFFPLRSDIENLSTAFYLAELFSELAPENAESESLLKLLLNSIYLLSEKKMDRRLIKSVAELRSLSDSGYAPDLVACCKCGNYETDKMYFNPESAAIYCNDCGNRNKGIEVSISTITAMRYIIYSEPKKIFSFALKEGALSELSYITEEFALLQTGKRYKTLDFLKSL